MAVLAAAAGLANEFAFGLHRAAQGFAIGHLRLAHIGVDLEFALHAIDDDFQMQFAHALDDGLAGFGIGMHAKRRIFLRQPLQGQAHFFLVDLGLRLHGHRDHRLREIHFFEDDDLVQIGQRVAGGDVLQAHRGCDIAGATSLISERSLACICSRRPMRSVRLRFGTNT